MLIKLNYSQETIKVIIESEKNEIFEYKLDEEINLTELVLRISELTELIEVSPSNFESFKESFKCKSENLLKVTEYIYQILEAFNSSYKEVYKEDIREKEAEKNVV